MKFVVSWINRPGLGESETKRLVDVYKTWQPPASWTIKEYLINADSNGGFIVVETDDPKSLFGFTTTLTPWVAWTVTPVLDVDEESMATIESALARWDAVP